jgi:tetratricopeptide (TPR) repeat protein
MSALPFTLDPEVEHILQEVARDPRSSLLRVERPKVIRGLLEREPTVGVATAGLTSAERHLVQTRRSETAYALRVLCLHAILADPRSKNLISRQAAAGEKELAALLSNFRRAWAANEQDHLQDLGDDAHAARKAVAGTFDAIPDVLQLTTLAQRLEPTDFGRVYAANWFQLESQHRSAVGLLLNVMSFPESRVMSAVVGTNLGLAYHRLGDYERSLAWYRKASEFLANHVPGVVGRLLVSIQLGSSEEAVASARLLDDLNSSDSPEIVWQCKSEGSRRAEFQSRLSDRGRELLPLLRDTSGPASRSLLHALES